MNKESNEISVLITHHSSLKIGVMGSANDTLPEGVSSNLNSKAESLGRAIAENGKAIILTGATTGLPYIAGKAAQAAGAFHVGISPAENEDEHINTYKLPTDNCDCLIFTGFGLKGRNVVLVRSCDIVLFIGGSIGSLNELTIACDEGKIIGCLTGTGGVADEAESLLKKFPKKNNALVFQNEDAKFLLEDCLKAFEENHK
jgi:uncharacterized protein (TIGR00725 family)